MAIERTATWTHDDGNEGGRPWSSACWARSPQWRQPVPQVQRLDHRQHPGHGLFVARHSGPPPAGSYDQDIVDCATSELTASTSQTRSARPTREDGAVVRHTPSDCRQPAGIGGVQPLHRGVGGGQGGRCENRTGQMAPCADPLRGLHAEPRHSHARSGTSGATQPGQRPGHHQRLRSLFPAVSFCRRGLPPLPPRRRARRRDRAVRATTKGVALVAAALCGGLATVALRGSPSPAAPARPPLRRPPCA